MYEEENCKTLRPWRVCDLVPQDAVHLAQRHSYTNFLQVWRFLTSTAQNAEMDPYFLLAQAGIPGPGISPGNGLPTHVACSVCSSLTGLDAFTHALLPLTSPFLQAQSRPHFFQEASPGSPAPISAFMGFQKQVWSGRTLYLPCIVPHSVLMF